MKVNRTNMIQEMRRTKEKKRREQHIPLPLSLLPLFRLFKTTAGALTGVFYLLKAETYELTLHTHTYKHTHASMLMQQTHTTVFQSSANKFKVLLLHIYNIYLDHRTQRDLKPHFKTYILQSKKYQSKSVVSANTLCWNYIFLRHFLHLMTSCVILPILCYITFQFQKTSYRCCVGVSITLAEGVTANLHLH